MVDIRIYVEGGGDQNSLKTKCRKGFRLFFEKILPKGKTPKIIACGSRKDAYDRFCTAVTAYENTFCILLVDSEEAVRKNRKRWTYLKERQEYGWDKPDKAEEENVHLMLQCMEAGFCQTKNVLLTFTDRASIQMPFQRIRMLK